FDNVLTHGEAIMAAGYSFCSQSAAAFATDSRSPELVDLILGLQRETKTGPGHRPAAHQAFPGQLRERLTGLAQAGVPMMVSGAYVASGARNCPDAVAFLRSVLGVELRSDNAAALGRVSEVRSPYSAFFGGGTFSYSDELGEKPYAVTMPDAIIPCASGASTIMRYDENQSPAAVAFESPTHKASTFGFPFEAITDKRQRNKLMNQILNFLK
ncbi:MAG: xanthan lyase, partial [Muribaculaceae bacterium]|nr:xanthan lyase [Muribaculaceae bacterium]